VGEGSVNWDAVRQADQAEVFECIRSGGLADVKSRDIKKILQLVYEENQTRRKELEESSSNVKEDKISDIQKAKHNVLSLDHLHEMSSEDAFNKLVQYPGIGPKTASCVLLFCMQRPSFAVDTHVFRLTRWLGWTPSDTELKRMAKTGPTKISASTDAKDIKAEDGEAPTPSKSTGKRSRGPPPVTRNTTYSHLDVRIPDELKYPLHYLLIKHGKTCPSCSAKRDRTVKEAWGTKVCPLKGLKRGSKRVAGLKAEELDEEGDESSGLSEVDDEEVEHNVE